MADNTEQIRIETSAETSAAQANVRALNVSFAELNAILEEAYGRAAGVDNVTTSLDLIKSKTAETVIQKRQLKDGLQGIGTVATLIEPSLGRYIALMNSLKIAQQGVEAASGNVKAALGAIAAQFANPYLLGAIALFAGITFTISKLREETEREAEAQRQANEQLRERIELQKRANEEAQARQRTEAQAVAQALATAGALDAAAPKEQERRVLGTVSRLQADTAAPRDDVIAAVVMAELGGFANDLVRIREIINTMQLQVGGKELTAAQADQVREVFRDRAETAAQARRGSSLGDAAQAQAAAGAEAAGLSGAAGEQRARDIRRADELTESIARLEAQQAALSGNEGGVLQRFADNLLGLFGRASIPTTEAQRQIQQQIDRLQSEASRVEERINAGIYVAPGGHATIYNDSNPFQPGPTGLREGTSRGFAD